MQNKLLPAEYEELTLIINDQIRDLETIKLRGLQRAAAEEINMWKTILEKLNDNRTSI